MQPKHEIPRTPVCDNSKIISYDMSPITSDNSLIMSVTSTKEEEIPTTGMFLKY